MFLYESYEDLKLRSQNFYTLPVRFRTLRIGVSISGAEKPSWVGVEVELRVCRRCSERIRSPTDRVIEMGIYEGVESVVTKNNKTFFFI